MGVQFQEKKRYVTLEWPLRRVIIILGWLNFLAEPSSSGSGVSAR